jgi:Fe-S cluster biosynthesis and repair protein YggX
VVQGFDSLSDLCAAFAIFAVKSSFEMSCKIILYSLQPRELMPHTVFCVKFKKEMPGLDEPPFDNELGKKVYDNVSQEAWRMWMEHCKMLLNEYRLNPSRREDQEVIVKQLEMFFFGEGSAKPKEYVPPAEK